MLVLGEASNVPSISESANHSTFQREQNATGRGVGSIDHEDSRF